MATRAVSSRWQRAAASLIERVGKQSASSTDSRPERLYHFTDCAGLIGIFEKRTLWASLATSLNDPSEVRYGLDLACDLFRTGTIAAKNFSLEGMDELVAARATVDIRTRQRWRAWLSKNHASNPGIWLVRHKQHTGVKLPDTRERRIRESIKLLSAGRKLGLK